MIVDDLGYRKLRQSYIMKMLMGRVTLHCKLNHNSNDEDKVQYEQEVISTLDRHGIQAWAVDDENDYSIPDWVK